MQLKISTLCDVGKKMTTTRQKGSDLVTCQISIKGVRVPHESMDELAGLPIGTTAPLFDENGAPRQRMSFLFPKRGLIVKNAKLQLRRESGAAAAELSITTAVASDLRFNLDTPDDKGPTSMFSFTLIWKAAGDEVSDVEPLLACGDKREKAWMEMTFEEENTTKPLFESSTASKTAEEEAGERAKLDRKRQAAGERPSDNEEAPRTEADEMMPAAVEAVTSGKVKPSVSAVQRALKISYNRADRLIEAMEQLGLITSQDADGSRKLIAQGLAPLPEGVVVSIKEGKRRRASTLSEMEREAQELARKHPRKDPPKGGGRDGGRRH